MNAHMIAPRCWIALDHIGVMFQAGFEPAENGFVRSPKWLRQAAEHDPAPRRNLGLTVRAHPHGDLLVVIVRKSRR